MGLSTDYGMAAMKIASPIGQIEDHYGTFMNASYTFFEITFSGGCEMEHTSSDPQPDTQF